MRDIAAAKAAVNHAQCRVADAFGLPVGANVDEGDGSPVFAALARAYSALCEIEARKDRATLAAVAAFCGWDPEASGPVDEASDRKLLRFARERWPEYRSRVFRVNGEPETCTAALYVRCNAEDLYVLTVASALGVGEVWDDYHSTLERIS